MKVHIKSRISINIAPTLSIIPTNRNISIRLQSHLKNIILSLLNSLVFGYPIIQMYFKVTV